MLNPVIEFWLGPRTGLSNVCEFKDLNMNALYNNIKAIIMHHGNPCRKKKFSLLKYQNFESSDKNSWYKWKYHNSYMNVTNKNQTTKEKKRSRLIIIITCLKILKTEEFINKTVCE